MVFNYFSQAFLKIEKGCAKILPFFHPNFSHGLFKYIKSWQADLLAWGEHGTIIEARTILLQGEWILC